MCISFQLTFGEVELKCICEVINIAITRIENLLVSLELFLMIGII